MPRVGVRRSDRRWKAPDGVIWASKFEWEVYTALLEDGIDVRKCDSSDTFSYTQQRPNVKCVECGSVDCVQERTYTPDLYIRPEASEDDSSGYYIEVKGYFREEKRRLFRCLRASRSDVDLRVIFATDHWVRKGKTRLSDYFDRYVKNTPYHFWDGGIPGAWK